MTDGIVYYGKNDKVDKTLTERGNKILRWAEKQGIETAPIEFWDLPEDDFNKALAKHGWAEYPSDWRNYMEYKNWNVKQKLGGGFVMEVVVPSYGTGLPIIAYMHPDLSEAEKLSVIAHVIGHGQVFCNRPLAKACFSDINVPAFLSEYSDKLRQLKREDPEKALAAFELVRRVGNLIDFKAPEGVPPLPSEKYGMANPMSRREMDLPPEMTRDVAGVFVENKESIIDPYVRELLPYERQLSYIMRPYYEVMLIQEGLPSFLEWLWVMREGGTDYPEMRTALNQSLVGTMEYGLLYGFNRYAIGFKLLRKVFNENGSLESSARTKEGLDQVLLQAKLYDDLDLVRDHFDYGFWLNDMKSEAWMVYVNGVKQQLEEAGFPLTPDIMDELKKRFAEGECEGMYLNVKDNLAHSVMPAAAAQMSIDKGNFGKRPQDPIILEHDYMTPFEAVQRVPDVETEQGRFTLNQKFMATVTGDMYDKLFGREIWVRTINEKGEKLRAIYNDDGYDEDYETHA